MCNLKNSCEEVRMAILAFYCMHNRDRSAAQVELPQSQVPSVRVIIFCVQVRSGLELLQWCTEAAKHGIQKAPKTL
jgi:hypothetical protein